MSVCSSLEKGSYKNIRLIAGFTLVELLVVISIIALLLAVLIPSLNRARMQAIKIVCASNMKQTVLAMRMYNSNNGGYFPPDYQLTPVDYTVWQQHLVPYAGENGAAFTCANFEKSYYARFGKPVNNISYHNFYNWYTPSGVASFGFNHRALSCTGSYDGWSCLSTNGKITLKARVEQVKRPSQLIMILDFSGFLSFGNMWPPNYSGPDWYRDGTGGVFVKKYIHNDGVNIAFVDGHYEWAPVKSKYFDYYQGTEDTHNPYWFNDRVGYKRSN